MGSELKIKIGQKIKEIRKSLKLTQEELGKKVGSNFEHISKLENGKVNSSVDYLEKIANALNVKIEILFKK